VFHQGSGSEAVCLSLNIDAKSDLQSRLASVVRYLECSVFSRTDNHMLLMRQEGNTRDKTQVALKPALADKQSSSGSPKINGMLHCNMPAAAPNNHSLEILLHAC
jgi:hypothetical protein